MNATSSKAFTFAAALAVSCLLGAANQTHATLISVDFAVRGPSPTFSGPAVLSGGADIWNGPNFANGGGGSTAANLLDSNGVVTSVTLNLSGFADVGGDVPGVAATDAVDLMRDYLFHSNGGGTADFDLSGLPASTPYTLVFYGAGDGVARGDGSTFSVTGANEGPQSTLGPLAAPLSSPQHYVTFTGTTSASGTIDADWIGIAGKFSGFNGFQISLIPEPSALALGMLGIVGFGFRRNR